MTESIATPDGSASVTEEMVDGKIDVISVPVVIGMTFELSSFFQFRFPFLLRLELAFLGPDWSLSFGLSFVLFKSSL